MPGVVFILWPSSAVSFFSPDNDLKQLVMTPDNGAFIEVYAVPSGKIGIGSNVTGKILMKIRDELQSGT